MGLPATAIGVILFTRVANLFSLAKMLSTRMSFDYQLQNRFIINLYTSLQENNSASTYRCHDDFCFNEFEVPDIWRQPAQVYLHVGRIKFICQSSIYEASLLYFAGIWKLSASVISQFLCCLCVYLKLSWVHLRNIIILQNE